MGILITFSRVSLSPLQQLSNSHPGLAGYPPFIFCDARCNGVTLEPLSLGRFLRLDCCLHALRMPFIITCSTSVPSRHGIELEVKKHEIMKQLDVIRPMKRNLTKRKTLKINFWSFTEKMGKLLIFFHRIFSKFMILIWPYFSLLANICQFWLRLTASSAVGICLAADAKHFQTNRYFPSTFSKVVTSLKKLRHERKNGYFF